MSVKNSNDTIWNRTRDPVAQCHNQLLHRVHPEAMTQTHTNIAFLFLSSSCRGPIREHPDTKLTAQPCQYARQSRMSKQRASIAAQLSDAI